MFRIMPVLFVILSSPMFAKAQDTKTTPTALNKGMIKTFGDLKIKLLAMDLSKKSRTDTNYLEAFESLQKAFETLNDAYLATKLGPDTVEYAEATTKASIDIVFLRTPNKVLKQANEESCSDTWYELQSSKDLDPILFSHYKTFLKNRCDKNWLPGIDNP